METQHFKRNLLLNLYREGKTYCWFVSSCCLREIKMSGTCSLFPPFGDPWPSCLLPSHFQNASQAKTTRGNIRLLGALCTVLNIFLTTVKLLNHKGTNIKPKMSLRSVTAPVYGIVKEVVKGQPKRKK